MGISDEIPQETDECLLPVLCFIWNVLQTLCKDGRHPHTQESVHHFEAYCHMEMIIHVNYVNLERVINLYSQSIYL